MRLGKLPKVTQLDSPGMRSALGLGPIELCFKPLSIPDHQRSSVWLDGPEDKPDTVQHSGESLEPGDAVSPHPGLCFCGWEELLVPSARAHSGKLEECMNVGVTGPIRVSYE